MNLKINPVNKFSTILFNKATLLGDAELQRSAIVFAPHHDDETLGCGGTIIKKLKHGAKVKIVFLTDGSGSHANLMDDNSLKKIRMAEAIEASEALGLTKDALVFLNYPEASFAKFSENAVEQVRNILNSFTPEEIYIPYKHDVHPHHILTNSIVKDALGKEKTPAIIYEFPIWFWNCWPWVGMELAPNVNSLRTLKNSISQLMQFTAFREFNIATSIEDVLWKKQEALDKHKSQMTNLNSSPDWKTLSDVSGGDFLRCFFRKYEVFLQGNF